MEIPQHQRQILGVQEHTLDLEAVVRLSVGAHTGLGKVGGVGKDSQNLEGAPGTRILRTVPTAHHIADLGGVVVVTVVVNRFQVMEVGIGPGLEEDTDLVVGVVGPQLIVLGDNLFQK